MRKWLPQRVEFGDFRDACGLGDTCMGAIIAEIMREHGISIYFYSKYPNAEALIHDVRRWRVFLNTDYVFEYEYPQFSIPLTQLNGMHFIDAFFTFNKLDMRYDGRAAHVVFEARQVPSVDVVMNTKSGSFSTARMWPYFSQLKNLLERKRISYCDLDELPFSQTSSEPSWTALNYAKSARLYLGLDSGLSHYVARCVSRGLILQSGHSRFVNWCGYHTYEALCNAEPCAPCWASENNPVICPGAHQSCMTRLSPHKVLRRIEELLDGAPLRSARANSSEAGGLTNAHEGGSSG